MQLLTSLNFNQNEMQNVALQSLVTHPTPAVAGQMYFNSASKSLQVYDGTNWLAGGTADLPDLIIGNISGLQTALDAKASIAYVNVELGKKETPEGAQQKADDALADAKVYVDGKVKTNVPTGAKFTETTINGKTGVIVKADIVALGIPATDTNTTYTAGTNMSLVAGKFNAVDTTYTAGENMELNGGKFSAIDTKYVAGSNVTITGSTISAIDTIVTKVDLGLDKVDNTTDLGKPISTSTQTALNAKVNNSRVLTDVPLNAKFTDTTYTATSLGLGNVDNTSDASKPVSSAQQTALDLKVDNSRVLTDVPANAKFTDTNTVTSINGKTGVIAKADIVALGIPAADTNTTYTAGTNMQLVGTKFSATDTLYTAGTHISISETNVISSTMPAATKASVGLGNVDNTSDLGKPISTATQTALNLKESIANVNTKAQTAENNAKAYTDTKLTTLVGSASEALDTLHEISLALGEDPNFAGTMTTELGKKTEKKVQVVGNGTLKVFTITHNMNSRDVTVQLRQTGSPYEVVWTDIELPTVNTAKITFAKAPILNEYTVTIIG